MKHLNFQVKPYANSVIDLREVKKNDTTTKFECRLEVI